MTCVVVTGDLLIIAVVSGGVKIVDLSVSYGSVVVRHVHTFTIIMMMKFCMHEHTSKINILIPKPVVYNYRGFCGKLLRLLSCT